MLTIGLLTVVITKEDFRCYGGNFEELWESTNVLQIQLHEY